MSSTPPPVHAGQRPNSGPTGAGGVVAARPADGPTVLAARLLVSVALLAGYGYILQGIVPIARAIDSVFETGPQSVTAPVLAVTLVGVLLIAVWWKFVKADARFHAPILITYILAIGNATFGILENHHSELLASLTGGQVKEYSPTFVAILAALVCELVMGRFMYGKWPHLASAYISGISVGILIKSPELWPFVMCALLSIVSKYAIRYCGRHLWNPSNLGVSALLFLAPATVATLSVQWSNTLWPMLIVWCLGILILYRVGRLHISLTYALSFALLALVRSAVTGDKWWTEVAPITGPMYQLYICFMITDPKTTTHRKWTQVAVAALVALVEMVLRLERVVHAPYYALFIVGPITNLIEIWWDGRRTRMGKTMASAGANGRPAAVEIPIAATGGGRGA